MYKIDNLTMEDIIFLEYSLFLYKQRLENEIIEVKIRIDKATKEDNTDDYKLYTHMLETKQASIIECDHLSNILQGVKTESVKKYNLDIDKYELATLKSLVKTEYKKVSDSAKNYNGFDRDMLEDSKFRLLLLAGKLDNIMIMGDKIEK